jgi:hypothetical protein
VTLAAPMQPLRRLAALSRPQRLALAASAVWVLIVVGYAAGFLAVAVEGQGRGTLFLDAMFFLVTLAVPLVLVWLAAFLADELARQRELVTAFVEVAAPLAGALAAPREPAGPTPGLTQDAVQRAVQAALVGMRSPDIERLHSGQARLELALHKMSLAAGRQPPAAGPEPRAADPAPAAPPADPEPPEAAAPEAPPADPEPPAPPAWPALIRALDFPRDPDDTEGFRALRAALRHPGLAQVLQAAEDVLNLLSQEGVFVDELEVDPVDSAAWRRFIAGVRGPEVAGLGGVRDPRAIDAARRLMASDSIFRDSALFFQRRFDRLLAEHGGAADDAEIEELAGTRSGRAFMLLVRLSGALD